MEPNAIKRFLRLLTNEAQEDGVMSESTSSMSDSTSHDNEDPLVRSHVFVMLTALAQERKGKEIFTCDVDKLKKFK